MQNRAISMQNRAMDMQLRAIKVPKFVMDDYTIGFLRFCLQFENLLVKMCTASFFEVDGRALTS